MARSYERTRAHARIDTRNAGKKAEGEAEAARLSAQYGLGDCTDSWDLSGFLARVMLGWGLILLVVLAWIGSLEPMPASEQMTSTGPALLVFLAAGLLMAAIRRGRGGCGCSCSTAASSG